MVLKPRCKTHAHIFWWRDVTCTTHGWPAACPPSAPAGPVTIFQKHGAATILAEKRKKWEEVKGGQETRVSVGLKELKDWASNYFIGSSFDLHHIVNGIALGHLGHFCRNGLWIAENDPESEIRIFHYRQKNDNPRKIKVYIYIDITTAWPSLYIFQLDTGVDEDKHGHLHVSGYQNGK